MRSTEHSHRAQHKVRHGARIPVDAYDSAAGGKLADLRRERHQLRSSSTACLRTAAAFLVTKNGLRASAFASPAASLPRISSSVEPATLVLVTLSPCYVPGRSVSVRAAASCNLRIKDRLHLVRLKGVSSALAWWTAVLALFGVEVLSEALLVAAHRTLPCVQHH
jgi:hypothetical protein